MQANLHEEMFNSWCAFFTQGLPLDLFVAFQKGLLSRCSTKAKPATRTYNCNDTEDAHPPVAKKYYVFGRSANVASETPCCRDSRARLRAEKELPFVVSLLRLHKQLVTS